MSDKKQVNEAPLDFLRGASNRAGQMAKQKAQSVADAGRRVYTDVRDAGRAESAKGDLARATKVFVRDFLSYLNYHGRDGSEYQQPQKEPQATPDAFRTNTKPKGKMGEHGFEYTFDSFLNDIYNGGMVNEGMMDFVKGAGAHVAQRIGDKINKYAQQGSWVKDIYNAGKQASQAGDEQRDIERGNQSRGTATQSLRAMLELAKQVPNAGEVIQQVIQQAVQDPVMQKRVWNVISQNAGKVGAKV